MHPITGTVILFLCISLGSHLDFVYPFDEFTGKCHTNGTKFVDAQKTGIAVSADGGFGEMKQTYVQKAESWHV